MVWSDLLLVTSFERFPAHGCRNRLGCACFDVPRKLAKGAGNCEAAPFWVFAFLCALAPDLVVFICLSRSSFYNSIRSLSIAVYIHCCSMSLCKHSVGKFSLMTAWSIGRFNHFTDLSCCMVLSRIFVFALCSFFFSL